MAMNRITMEWSGFQGAPGYSNFFFTDLSSAPGPEAGFNQVVAFAQALRPRIPNGVQLLVRGEAAIIDETTGMVEDYVIVDQDSDPMPGVGAGGYSAASGAVITWNTAGVRNGRRVRGRTFLVPLNSTSYEGDGTLDADALDDIRGAAEILTGEGFDSGFCVFSRPSNGAAGGAYPVTGFRVPDMAAVLRSRRD